eukprot:526197_1
MSALRLVTISIRTNGLVFGRHNIFSAITMKCNGYQPSRTTQQTSPSTPPTHHDTPTTSTNTNTIQQNITENQWPDTPRNKHHLPHHPLTMIHPPQAQTQTQSNKT